jgi:hypothetical protein
MFDEIKKNIFTVHGVLTTMIHVFLAVGFVTTWVIVQVHVFGNDPTAVLQGPTASAPKGKK